MKAIYVPILGALLLFSSVYAQSGGGGGASGSSSGAAAATIEPGLAIQILQVAYPEFYAEMGITFGFLVAEYRRGNVIITILPEGNYRVSYGGCVVIVLGSDI